MIQRIEKDLLQMDPLCSLSDGITTIYSVFVLRSGRQLLYIDLSDGQNSPITPFDGWAKTPDHAVCQLGQKIRSSKKRSPPGELPRYDLPRKLETNPVGCFLFCYPRSYLILKKLCAVLFCYVFPEHLLYIKFQSFEHSACNIK